MNDQAKLDEILKKVKEIKAILAPRISKLKETSEEDHFLVKVKVSEASESALKDLDDFERNIAEEIAKSPNLDVLKPIIYHFLDKSKLVARTAQKAPGLGERTKEAIESIIEVIDMAKGVFDDEFGGLKE
jgi:hypothetical protein